MLHLDITLGLGLSLTLGQVFGSVFKSIIPLLGNVGNEYKELFDNRLMHTFVNKHLS